MTPTRSRTNPYEQYLVSPLSTEPEEPLIVPEHQVLEPVLELLLHDRVREGPGSRLHSQEVPAEPTSGQAGEASDPEDESRRG